MMRRVLEELVTIAVDAALALAIGWSVIFVVLSGAIWLQRVAL